MYIHIHVHVQASANAAFFHTTEYNIYSICKKSKVYFQINSTDYMYIITHALRIFLFSVDNVGHLKSCVLESYMYTYNNMHMIRTMLVLTLEKQYFLFTLDSSLDQYACFIFCLNKVH